ncbi:hypothetical protein HYT18_04655 [Candidatus Microgenomates bacterium]|nr:hypothetical protein [Candidatus Microgenomates bacterium]
MKSQMGLTLMEAIIATAITAVLGILLLVIIINSSNLFYKQTSKVEQGRGINDTLSKVRETIKQSQGVNSTYPPSGAPTYTSGSQQIVLKVPAIDNLGNTISNTFDYFVFFLDQDKLRFKVFPDISSSRKSSDQLLSINADSLTFQYYNSANPPSEVLPTSATKVKISLTLRQKSGPDYEQQTATSEANLRND